MRLCTASVCGEASDEAEAEPLLTEKGEAVEDVAGASTLNMGRESSYAERSPLTFFNHEIHERTRTTDSAEEHGW